MFDAASRLAEGRPAVDAIQDYVWACHLLGYEDPDLTLNASQVRDWYCSEDGIDLQALDADCETLWAAAAAGEEALARQDAQLASMAVAWDGQGAQASREFLRRHGEESAGVVAAVRTAAESLSSLRDRLWHSVDGKVAATMAVEARGANPEWRAAAETVTTGAGDRAAASELVDQEVKPFVENVIRSEWLGAMRSAMAAVTEAYDAAVAELASEVAVGFDVPGELGPSWSPPPSESVATVPAGAGSVAGPVAAAPVGVGAAAPGPSAWSAPTVPPASLSAPPPLGAAAPPVEPAAMAPTSMPSMGGGMPDVGSGLSGFGGQLGDLLGGLLGTSQDALSDLPEPDEVDEPDDLDPLEDDEEKDELEDDDEKEEAEAESPAESDPVFEDAVPTEEPPAEPLPADVEPTPMPTPAPPPIEPLAAPAPAAGTPCEIAANELPQVGE